MKVKRALITGSEGFIGRRVCDELEYRDWDIDRCDLTAIPRSDAMEVFRMNNFPYDLVVHCAAQGANRLAIDTKFETFPYNVMLDAAMFSWAIRTKQKNVLYFSSCAAYPAGLQSDGPRDARKFHEDMIQLDSDGRSPYDSYGWTKLTGERMAAAVRKHGVPVTVVRPFSGYGEEQSTDFPFNAMISKMRSRPEEIEVWGNGDQIRDWIHVEDVVKGALAAIERAPNMTVNLCTGIGTSIRQLVYMIAVIDGWGPGPNLKKVDGPWGARYRVGDPTHLNRFYIPRISLAEGITRALSYGG